jgi:hypothetical protein
MQKYFSSALTDDYGVPWYYQFFVMVYGLNSVVYAVTKFKQPIKASCTDQRSATLLQNVTALHVIAFA